MEDVSVSLSNYYNSLERLLKCPKEQRGRFLEQTRRMAEDYMQGNPDATPQEVTDFLGDPRELAREFLDTLDPELLERYQKNRKIFRIGCVSVLAVALIIVTIWGGRRWSTPKTMEVAETLTVYAETTEAKR